MKPMSKILAAAALGATAFASAAFAADISGAGSTFVYPIAAKWADVYKKDTGVGLNYQSIGSGGGIKQIKAKTVTFGASDAPLSGDDLKDIGLLQFPIVMGGIVPVLNVQGIQPGQLTFDGPTLAQIFMGKITKWNDKAIARLNPGVNLPATAIAVVHRSDGSGTTFNFTTYLAQVDNGWRVNVGASTAIEWPVGIGGKGNEGVANMVAQTQGAIGYVEYAYALQNKMTYTKMINKAGKTVGPSLETFQAAAANADWSSKPGFGVILANQPGEKSWPITASTWVLVYASPVSASDTAEALKFFDWSYRKGNKMAEGLDYVPMPDSVVAQIEKTWAQIKDGSGKAVWK